MDKIARTADWGKRWAKGMMRTIPKEVGNSALDKQIPITVFTAKAKGITGTMKLRIKNFLVMMVRKELKGFMPGRTVDGHLHKVMEVPSQDEPGPWVRIVFLKAYDKVGPP